MPHFTKDGTDTGIQMRATERGRSGSLIAMIQGDRRDADTMLARHSINAYNDYWRLGRQSPTALEYTEGLGQSGNLRAWFRTQQCEPREALYWHGKREGK